MLLQERRRKDCDGQSAQHKRSMSFVIQSTEIQSERQGYATLSRPVEMGKATKGGKSFARWMGMKLYLLVDFWH